MVHKVLRVGDSVGITLPKQNLKSMGIVVGDKVTIDYSPERKEIIIKPVKKSKKNAVSTRVAHLTARFIDRYRDALKQLA